jgi:hypothetical protein
MIITITPRPEASPPAQEDPRPMYEGGNPIYGN